MVWLLNFQGMKNFKKYWVILSQHTDYLHKWSVHLHFDTFTAAMSVFFCEIPKYVQA